MSCTLSYRTCWPQTVTTNGIKCYIQNHTANSITLDSSARKLKTIFIGGWKLTLASKCYPSLSAAKVDIYFNIQFLCECATTCQRYCHEQMYAFGSPISKYLPDSLWQCVQLVLHQLSVQSNRLPSQTPFVLSSLAPPFDQPLDHFHNPTHLPNSFSSSLCPDSHSDLLPAISPAFCIMHDDSSH